MRYYIIERQKGGKGAWYYLGLYGGATVSGVVDAVRGDLGPGDRIRLWHVIGAITTTVNADGEMTNTEVKSY